MNMATGFDRRHPHTVMGDLSPITLTDCSGGGGLGLGRWLGVAGALA
jgi:hypothetical protein